MSETMEMAVAGEVRSITAITDEIIFYKNVGGQAVIEIGKRLIEAKAQLKHGEWLPWLSEKVEFSETSAQRFMQLAREYGNTSLVGIWGPQKPWYYWLCRHLSERILQAKNTLSTGKKKALPR